MQSSTSISKVQKKMEKQKHKKAQIIKRRELRNKGRESLDLSPQAKKKHFTLSFSHTTLPLSPLSLFALPTNQTTEPLPNHSSLATNPFVSASSTSTIVCFTHRISIRPSKVFFFFWMVFELWLVAGFVDCGGWLGHLWVVVGGWFVAGFTVVAGFVCGLW